MTVNTDMVIRALTTATLTGLLFSIGLRLTAGELVRALRGCRLAWILPANFILVPALAVLLARLFQLPPHLELGMSLLAAAPFAPVVPTFTRLARGDLALAGVLTGVFPFLSAFLTPLVCQVSLHQFLVTGWLKFDWLSLLGILVATITAPLAAGVICREYWPSLGRRLMHPVQLLSEAAGAVSLIYVTVTQFPTIRAVGWNALLAMALLSELAFLVGYALSGPAREARLVVGLGTANRNIALALLVAVASFPGTPALGAVVANGLLLILLGLVHVGAWRWWTKP